MEDPVKLAPPYDWRVTLWKGLRPALIAAAVAAAGAFLTTIDVKTLVDIGVPQFLAVLLVEAGRNWWKQHRV